MIARLPGRHGLYACPQIPAAQANRGGRGEPLKLKEHGCRSAPWARGRGIVTFVKGTLAARPGGVHASAARELARLFRIAAKKRL